MKKLISLLLAVVMLLSLVACGSTVENAGTGEDDYDPDAQWAGIYTDPQWDGSLPLVQEGEDNVITFGLSPNTNVLDYDNNDFTLWLEEQTGVDLQFVTLAPTAKDAVTQFNLMAAGGEELPDIVHLSSSSKSHMKTFGQDGYFLNLAGYLATDAYYTRQAMELYYGDRYDWAESYLHDVIVDPATGGFYGFPRLNQNSMDNIRCHTWINQQWLDNLGLTAPTNIDELYNVLVAFRDNDPNQNGLKDEIPMMGADASNYRDLIGWIINAYIFYNGTHKFNVENDVVYGPFDQDEYRQALIFIKKLVDEGLLSPMTWSSTTSERKSILNPVDDTFTVGIVAASFDEDFENGHDSIYRYEPLAPLADETGRGGYGPVKGDTLGYYMRITCDCDNPRLAFRFLDFLSSTEGYLRGRWGVQGVDWDYIDEGNTLPGNRGGEARFVRLGEDIFTEANSKNWHLQVSHISRDYWQFATDLSDGSWASTQQAKAIQIRDAYEAAGLPEQVFYEMCRNAEEDALFNEHHSDLDTFVKKARAEFCNGIRNPESDADWQQYLDELESLHYYDAWVGVAQASWDRQQSR